MISRTDRINRLVRPELAELEEYVPIVPLETLAARAGVPIEQVIKLDGNENPYGCSPRVRAALASFDRWHIYPDPVHVEARALLAEYAGLPAEQILMGNGSDELIDLVLRLVVGPGDAVINCEPTFGMYTLVIGLGGGREVMVPRREDFSLDLPAILAAVGPETKAIVVASPNNPTANTTPNDVLEQLLETGALIIVDEAYYEFSGVTAAPLLARYENLVVLRTFSKWAGLAGLRAGYALTSPELAGQFWKIKPPYNVNVAALVAVRESLRDADYLRATVTAMVKERPILSRDLGRLSFLAPLPSEANFIFCRVVRGEAAAIKRALDQRGIFIRHFDRPMLRNGLRISVGRPDQSQALVAALKDVAAHLGIADGA